MSSRSGNVAEPAPNGPRARQQKPRLALFVATASGLGYIPFAPGTFGSLGGLVAAVLPLWTGFTFALMTGSAFVGYRKPFDPVLLVQVFLAAAIGFAGVWSASRAARYWGEKDPQRVVIDEVSGQHLSLLLGMAVPIWWRPAQTGWNGAPLGLMTVHAALNWKYLLLGLILFRVFDILKPFPVRNMESLPGGWGIMADDWVAGIYAAAGLWLARALAL